MPMMLSGEPRHSGSRVTGAASTAWMISLGGSSASIVTMLVRWTMTSQTESSRRSSTPPIMSRSSFSTVPSRCMRSTAPRSSSCGDRIDWFLPTGMPTPRSITRTSHSTPRRTGENQRTMRSIGWATASAMRSGALKAAVFGSTSHSTKINTVMPMVA